MIAPCQLWLKHVRKSNFGSFYVEVKKHIWNHHRKHLQQKSCTCMRGRLLRVRNSLLFNFHYTPVPLQQTHGITLASIIHYHQIWVKSHHFPRQIYPGPESAIELFNFQDGLRFKTLLKQGMLRYIDQGYEKDYLRPKVSQEHGVNWLNPTQSRGVKNHIIQTWNHFPYLEDHPRTRLSG